MFLMLAFLVLPLLLICQDCGSPNASFYDTILSDFGTHSTFIVVEVEAKEYKGRVLIENSHLFYYFNQTKGFNEKQYAAYAKDILSRKTKIVLNDEDLSTWGFAKVDEVASVKATSLEGCKKFIDHYFKGKVLTKEAAMSNERNAVIDQLFAWHIATEVDDESGYLVIKVLPCKD